MKEFIGIPYEQLDCWDLVQAVYARYLDMDLGDRTEQSGHIKDGTWGEVNVEELQRYDVLVFDDGFQPHVGLVIDGGRFLHTIAGVNSCVDSYKRSQWRDRLRKAYRHKRLAYMVV